MELEQDQFLAIESDKALSIYPVLSLFLSFALVNSAIDVGRNIYLSNEYTNI